MQAVYLEGGGRGKGRGHGKGGRQEGLGASKLEPLVWVRLVLCTSVSADKALS